MIIQKSEYQSLETIEEKLFAGNMLSEDLKDLVDQLDLATECELEGIEFDDEAYYRGSDSDILSVKISKLEELAYETAQYGNVNLIPENQFEDVAVAEFIRFALNIDDDDYMSENVKQYLDYSSIVMDAENHYVAFDYQGTDFFVRG